VIARAVVEGIEGAGGEGRVEISLARLEASAFASLGNKEPLI
jgi:hypothetical protein